MSSHFDELRRKELSYYDSCPENPEFSFHNPFLQKAFESQEMWIINQLIPYPLTVAEEKLLPELVKDKDWLNSKSYLTSEMAQKPSGPVGDFHTRWQGVPSQLLKRQFPLRRASVKHPYAPHNLYFLVYDPAMFPTETAVDLDELTRRTEPK
jgi:hypothetical protein